MVITITIVIIEFTIKSIKCQSFPRLSLIKSGIYKVGNNYG